MSSHTVIRRSAAMFLAAFSILLLPGLAGAASYSALVVDARTGRTLYEENAREFRHPASLTKMMTLYLVFDAFEKGRLSPYQRLWVSDRAAAQPPTKLGLKPGQTIAVREAIYGLVTKSANDAAVVIAEALGNTEPQFAMMMTSQARLLGMSQTAFYNASGLHDPRQVTTAWDMYQLAIALQRDFPQHYYYFSTPNFYFNNRIHANHNKLLKTCYGVDGIKTGYTRASGFNLVASATRNGQRVIGVVLGGSSASSRDANMRDMLDQGFAMLANPSSAPTLMPARYSAPAPAYPPSGFPPAQISNRSQPGLNTIRPTASAWSAPTQTVSPRQARQDVEDETYGDDQEASANTRLLTNRNSQAVSTRVASTAANRSAPAAVASSDWSGGNLNWELQVGAFSDVAAAREQFARVYDNVPNQLLLGAKAAVVPFASNGKTLYRARFNNLTATKAGAVCQALKQKQITCVVVGPSG